MTKAEMTIKKWSPTKHKLSENLKVARKTEIGTRRERGRKCWRGKNVR